MVEWSGQTGKGFGIKGIGLRNRDEESENESSRSVKTVSYHLKKRYFSACDVPRTCQSKTLS